MKTKQELDEIRQDCVNLESKLKELNEEELNLVTGGRPAMLKKIVLLREGVGNLDSGDTLAASSASLVTAGPAVCATRAGDILAKLNNK